MTATARPSVLVTALCLVGWAQGMAAPPALNQALGPHPVGFRVVRQVDATREFRRSIDPLTGEPATGERARPLQTLLWYPARAKGQPLRHADYLATRETELSTGPCDLKAAAARQREALIRKRGQAGAEVADGEVEATAEAPPAKGPFPLILYAAGADGSADENADLCEYFASHGYVVLASTSLGASDKTLEESMAGVEPQIRDLQCLIGYAHTLPQVDLRKIAVLGWSWGGMANVFAASRDGRIGAIISLDGTREPALTRQIDVRRLTVPWLYVSRSPDTIPELNRSGIDTTFSLLNAARHAPVTQVIAYPMGHADFISSRLREAVPAAYREYSREEVRQAFGIVALFSRNFLDAHLKGDTRAQTLLARDPRELGAAPHAFRIIRGPAPTPPVTRHALAQALAHQGFDRAVEVFRALQLQDPAFTLPPEELQAWAEGLLALGRAGAACGIFQLWTVLHPQDADAFDGLGRGLEAAGQGTRAVDGYARALALRPTHRHASERLKTLGAGAPATSR